MTITGAYITNVSPPNKNWIVSIAPAVATPFNYVLVEIGSEKNAWSVTK